MQVNKKERIEFIDLAKGICILLVMILHLIPTSLRISNLLNLECLRMPLYFCLAGMFFKDYGSFKNLFLKKTSNILIPFIAWYVISYAIYYIALLTIMSDIEDKYHYLDLFRGDPTYNRPIWFLLCLFWSSLIFDLIFRITKNWWIELTLICLCALGGVVWSKSGLPNYLYFGTCLTSMPFYFLGYTLKRSLILAPNDISKKEYAIMGACFIGFMIIACYPSLRARYQYVTNEFASEGSVLLTYFSCIMVVVAVLFLCKKIKKISYISYLGRYSIIVLVTHMLFGSVVGKTLAKINIFATHEKTLHFLVFIIVFLMMFVAIPIFKTYLPYITAQKDIFSTISKVSVNRKSGIITKKSQLNEI